MVVRIIYSTPYVRQKLRPRVEVYSLNSGKWMSVRADIHHVVFGGGCTFVNGCLHWQVTRNFRERNEWVKTFDLKDEVVREVEMPNGYDADCPDNDYFPVNILNWNGSISLCVCKPPGDYMERMRCCFWMMEKDNDGKLLWKRKFNLSMKDDPTGMTVGVSFSGKLVIDALDLQKCAQKRVCVLNPVDTKSKTLTSDDGPYTVDSQFMESLVLLVN